VTKEVLANSSSIRSFLTQSQVASCRDYSYLATFLMLPLLEAGLSGIGTANTSIIAIEMYWLYCYLVRRHPPILVTLPRER
jgi:hypothetical protein